MTSQRPLYVCDNSAIIGNLNREAARLSVTLKRQMHSSLDFPFWFEDCELQFNGWMRVKKLGVNGDRGAWIPEFVRAYAKGPFYLPVIPALSQTDKSANS